jgi:hypothetical protein
MQLLKRLVLLLFTVLTALFVLLSAWSHQNKELAVNSAAEKNWQPLVTPWESQTDIVAYYSFQDEFLRNGKLRNRASLLPNSLRDLKYIPNTASFKTVEGRWPGKQTIELDNQVIRLPKHCTDGDAFALSVWIKHSGLGSISGDNFGNIATIIALSDGRWKGWRIDLIYPSNRIGFYLARKQGEPTVGVVSAIRVPPKTWTHIAVTRDPANIRIYVNGLLAGETPHDVKPAPITIIDSLKLGYTGTGYCSAIVQLDDLLIRSSLPPHDAWLTEAMMEPREMFPHTEQWTEVTNRFFEEKLDESISLLMEIKKSLPATSRSRHAIDFRLAETHVRLGKMERAQDIYLDIILSSTAPENIRLSALHEYLAIGQGVNEESDPSRFAYRREMNCLPDESQVATASYRYINAASYYDYYTPLDEKKMQAIE